jgi:hypothetical protein
MCGKEEFASNSEEYTSRDDIVEEERMVIHEGQTPEAEGTELSSSENMNSDFHEVRHIFVTDFPIGL